MANHKCYLCGKDMTYRDIQYGKTIKNYYGSTSYLHRQCYDVYEKIIKYIGKINLAKVRRQYQKLLQDGISPTEIGKTLDYWYGVKENSSKDSNGGIGIVEYVIDDAIDYYRHVAEREKLKSSRTETQKNEYKDIWEQPLTPVQKPKPFRRPIGVRYIDLK